MQDLSNMSLAHHAYLLVGSVAGGEEYLDRVLGEHSIVRRGNPDYFAFQHETFGIDEARELREMALKKAFGSKKIFFISPAAITTEAQNALLKTFEEPISDTHFFLQVFEEGRVLVTLRSRMEVVRVRDGEASSPAHGQGGKFATDNTSPSPKSFLDMQLKDRLTFAKDFEGNLPEFMDNLFTQIKDTNVLTRIYPLRRFATDRSASPRLILEHLSLVL